MNDKLSQELYKAHPRIFCNKDQDPHDSGSLMGLGICCGDGWFNIIKAICIEFENLYCNYGVIVKAAQIKEKFGGLRFYVDTDTDPNRTIVKRNIWLSILLSVIERVNRLPFVKYRFVHVENHLRCKVLKYYVHTTGPDNEPYKHVKPMQVNFGEVNNRITGITDMGESMSYFICENCGNPGELDNSQPWIRTLCKKCKKKNK